MSLDDMSYLDTAVEEHFANIEWELKSLDDFKAMLETLKANTEYCDKYLSFDIRSGLREHFNRHGDYRDTPPHISRNPGFVDATIRGKIAALKEAGFMDHLCIALLVDSCGMSGSYARRSAKGHTPELIIQFSSSTNNAIERKNILPQFVIDVIKFEIIRDAPLSIIEQANLNEYEMIDFATGTRRHDVLRLLSHKARREVLGNDLGM